MAWTFQLENATSTLDINDGTNYAVMPLGFDAPAPDTRAVFAGERNLFRSGARLVRQAYGNRSVTIRLKVLGATTDALATNVEKLETILRRAQEFSSFAAGSQVRLKYQWDSATNPVYFHVVTGTFNPIGGAQHTTFLTLNTTLMDAVLTLVCEPFAFGAQETLENYVRDPSFEVADTALADWTESKTATGTTARSTAQKKYGDASLLLTMTNSGGSGQVIERNQTLADVDAGENWSFSAWVYLTALSNSKAGLVLLYNDGSATTVTSYQTSTNSGFEKLSIANQTVPSGATQVILKVRLEATASSATGTCYFDAVTATEQGSLPNTFVSSREVMNHFDDDGQLHTNYMDINGLAGNQPGLLQVKAAENEAHTKFWVGARQGNRQLDGGIWHEAEDFVNTDWMVDNSDAACSAANETRISRSPAFSSFTRGNSSSSATATASSVNANVSRACIVAYVALQDNSGTETVTSVVFNGDESFTKIADSNYVSLYRLTTWILPNPSAATGNVVATLGAGVSYLEVAALVYTNVTDATTVHEDVQVTDGGSATSVSTSQSTTIGDLVVSGAAWNNSNNGTAGGGLTERGDNGGSFTLAVGDLVADATSETPSWSWSGAAECASVGLVLSAGADTPAAPVVLTKAITSPPRGQFRAIARADGQGAQWSLGMGYAYGTVTATPSVAGDYPATTSTSAGYEIVDMGTVTIPPVITPENMTTGSFTLRLALYLSTVATAKTIDLDWVMLLPIDFGSMYLSKTSDTDVVLVDSISDLRTATLIDTNGVVQSIPSSQGGDPPTVHPDGTRLYFASDDGNADIDDGFKISVIVEPRFLSVAGT